jgi:hypothetical protein
MVKKIPIAGRDGETKKAPNPKSPDEIQPQDVTANLIRTGGGGDKEIVAAVTGGGLQGSGGETEVFRGHEVVIAAGAHSKALVQVRLETLNTLKISNPDSVSSLHPSKSRIPKPKP